MLGEQRDRHACSRSREIGKICTRDAASSSTPTPCRRRQGPVRRRDDERRPARVTGPQDVRPEGRRRALRPASQSARPARADRSTAAATSAACAPARSTCRASSASARPREHHASKREARRERSASARCASGSARQAPRASSTNGLVNGSLEHRLPGNLNSRSPSSRARR